MKNRDKKNIIYQLLEVLFVMVIFAYLLINKTVYSGNSNYDMGIFLMFALVVVGVLLAAGPRFNRLLGFVLPGVLVLYYVAQEIYKRAFDQYFRLSTAMGLSQEVQGVTDSINELIIFEDYIPFIVLLIINLIFVVLFFIFQRNIKVSQKYKFASIALMFIGIMIGYFSVNSINKTQYSYTDFDIYKSDYYLYETVDNTNRFKETLGLNTLLFRDFVQFFDNDGDLEKYKTEIDNYFATNIYHHETNDMTGLLKDKDIILFVQAESLMNYGISEALTPNLYYYRQSGIVVEDFNTPLLVGSTSDTEFMTNTSFIPETDGYPVCYEYANNYFPMTLGNIFKDNDFNAVAFHNNYGEYYNRFDVFENYGYDFHDSSKLGFDNMLPDSALAEQIGWIMSEKEKSIGYWITFSGHQPYDSSSVAVSKDDVKLIKELYPDLDEGEVAYIAKAMDLDRALGTFVNVMDWSGRFDDFAIVVFGDHIVKGITTREDTVYAKDLNKSFNIADTPFFIYSPGLVPQTIEKPGTSLDIMPTITNMYDFDVDYSLMFGKDMFDDNYEGFYFGEGGTWYTNQFIYNTINDTYDLIEEITIEEAKKQVFDFITKKQICNKILISDYFSTNK